MLQQEMHSWSLNVVKCVKKRVMLSVQKSWGKGYQSEAPRMASYPVCQKPPAPVGLLSMQMLLINVYPDLKSTINKGKHALLLVLSSLPNSRTQFLTD